MARAISDANANANAKANGNITALYERASFGDHCPPPALPHMTIHPA